MIPLKYIILFYSQRRKSLIILFRWANSVKTILKVMVKLLVGVLHCINLLQMMLTMCVIIHVLFL